MIACGVWLVAPKRTCLATPAKPYSGTCRCGHDVTGDACQSCRRCLQPGCLTCWEGESPHVCPVELDKRPRRAARAGELAAAVTTGIALAVFTAVVYAPYWLARLFRGPSPYCYLSGGHGLKAPRNVVTVHAEEGTGVAYWDLPGRVFGTASRSPAEEAPALNAGQRAFESRREDQ